jgi:hypothetical protein
MSSKPSGPIPPTQWFTARLFFLLWSSWIGSLTCREMDCLISHQLSLGKKRVYQDIFLPTIQTINRRQLVGVPVTVPTRLTYPD